MDTIEKFDKYVVHSYNRYPLVMDSGCGVECCDENQKKYIDFGSGIGVNSLGFCDTQWSDAVAEQAKTLQHCSNYYYTAVQAEFAEKLCNASKYEKVFFCNSGAEANECAIKTARKYSFDKYGKGRSNIITLNSSFHGRTMATVSATGQEVFHNYFFPFLEGFINAEPNNIEDLKSKLDNTICAVMMEYIQGEGGVNNLEQDFIDAVYELCHERDILIIADEVQTGIGRTGKFLAGENFSKKADMTTLAKGIAGGLPMGACLMGEKVMNTLVPGTHASTFGGNPVACAGGIVVVDRVSNENFLDTVNEKSAYFRKRLEKCSKIGKISGMGLMIGITLKDMSASDVAKQAFDKGLLVLTAKDKLRFLPPLTIDYKEIDKGLDILIEILEG